MSEHEPVVEAFVSGLGFPGRRGETPEEHIGRVARLLVHVAPKLRTKMNQVFSAVAEGHDTDDSPVFGAVDEAVTNIKHGLRVNGPIKGLNVKEQVALLLDRVEADSVGNMPNEWKCAELSFPDGNLFDADKGTSAKALAAKSICFSCEKRIECLDQALAGGEDYNIWGGLSPTERRRIKARRAPR